MALLVRWRVPLVGLAVACFVFSGCNKQRNTTVIGRVLRDGKPIACSPTGYVQITLMPDVNEGENFTTRQARCEADGSYKIVEVPPGTYKIGIEQWDPTPQSDKLQGAFKPGDSKVIRDLDG